MPAEAAALAEVRAKPFLKWVGGKGKMLPKLQSRLPPEFPACRYHEPFLGGGALFFAARPARASLSDLNEPLINAYSMVRDQFDAFCRELEALAEAHSEESFQRARAFMANPDVPDAARAALFVYLNRTCFNGLWRVNKKGHFNVPYGYYPNPRIFDRDGLTLVHEALQGVDLNVAHFDNQLDGVGKGDFVYFDPPYMPASETSNFTAYNARGFDASEHECLAACARAIGERKGLFLMSQSNHPLIRKLYKGFIIEKVDNVRSVGASAETRGTVKELLIRNYR